MQQGRHPTLFLVVALQQQPVDMGCVSRLEDGVTKRRLTEHRADARERLELDAPDLDTVQLDADAFLGHEEREEELTGLAVARTKLEPRLRSAKRRSEPPQAGDPGVWDRDAVANTGRAAALSIQQGSYHLSDIDLGRERFAQLRQRRLGGSSAITASGRKKSAILVGRDAW